MLADCNNMNNMKYFVLGTAIAFSPWFLVYSILRACLGFISVSVVFSGFVLSIELVGGHWRTVAGISYLFPVSLSYMSIAGIAWLLREWRQLQLAISLPGFLFLGLWYVYLYTLYKFWFVHITH